VKKWLLPKEQAFHFELELKVQPVEDAVPAKPAQPPSGIASDALS